MHGNIDIELNKLKNAGFMFVHFDSYDRQVAKGKIQTLYYNHPFEFRSLGQLLLVIDDVLDSVGFEKESGAPHCLYEENEGKAKVFQYVDRDDIYKNAEVYDKNYANAFRGELVIRVLYRQNSSMQGEIREGERKVYFRSSLELLRLMYEYLEKRYQKESKL